MKMRILFWFAALGFFGCAGAPPDVIAPELTMPVHGQPTPPPPPFGVTVAPAVDQNTQLSASEGTAAANGESIAVAEDRIACGTSGGIRIATWDPQDAQWREHPIFPLPDATLDVLWESSVLYAANGPQGLFVIETADSGFLRVRRQLLLEGAALRLHSGEIDGKSLLVVAAGHQGALLFTGASEGEPVPAARHGGSGRVFHAVIANGAIYTAEGNGGVSKVRWSGSDMQPEWTLPSIDARAVAVDQRLLWVADGRGGGFVADIQESVPRVLGRFKDAEVVFDVASLSDGNRAVFALGQGGIALAALNSDGKVSVIGRRSIPFSVHRVTVQGDRVYAGMDNEGPLMFELTEFDRPGLIPAER